MKLAEGTKLKMAKWRRPLYLTLRVGEEKIKSLTVSIETGGPWVVIEYDGGATEMRPLESGVLVVVDETA